MKKTLAVMAAIATLMLLIFATAAFQANYGSFRDSGAGLVTNQPWCFEGTQGSGQDVCIKRPQAGHVEFQTGQGAQAPDVIGTKTLAAGSGTVTFVTAYTAAPICLTADQTGANATRAQVSTTQLIITGTGTDVISYACFGH